MTNKELNKIIEGAKILEHKSICNMNIEYMHTNIRVDSKYNLVVLINKLPFYTDNIDIYYISNNSFIISLSKYEYEISSFNSNAFNSNQIDKIEFDYIRVEN